MYHNVSDTSANESERKNLVKKCTRDISRHFMKEIEIFKKYVKGKVLDLIGHLENVN